MSDTLLDLDTILPQPKQVKLNGQLYQVLPTKLKDFIQIQKLFLSLQTIQEPEKQIETVEEINTVLRPIVPDIDKMELTFEQLFALLQFAYQSSAPKTEDSATEKKRQLCQLDCLFSPQFQRIYHAISPERIYYYLFCAT